MTKPLTKELVYKMSLPAEGKQWCVFDSLSAALEGCQIELEALSPGEQMVIEAAEMAKEELAALPDFPGW